MAELRGTGKSPQRWLLDRTTLTVQTPTERTVVPLDQLAHVHVGRRTGNPAMFAAAGLGVLLPVIVYVLSLSNPFYATYILVSLVAGIVIAGLCIAAYLLAGGRGPTVHTHTAQFTLEHPLDSDLDAFIEELIDVRNAYLEGIDTVAEE